MQKPLVKIGTELSDGKVVAIHKNGVNIEKDGNVATLSFTQVENEVFNG